MEIDFKSKFLNCDFDSILLNSNNPLLNSYDIYIQYKQKYIINARKNYDSYQKLFKEYSNLKKLQYHQINPNKIIYTYISDDKLNDLSFKIKNLVIEQQSSLDNFMHYITHLNKNVDSYIDQSKSTVTSLRKNKNIFTRLLEGGTKAKLKRRMPTT